MNSSSMQGFYFYLYIYIYIFSLIAPYSIFYKSSFTLKLNFEKIEFQNRDIYLISLGKGTKCWFFCMKMAFVHFGHKYNAKRIKHTTIERRKKKKKYWHHICLTLDDTNKKRHFYFSLVLYNVVSALCRW